MTESRDRLDTLAALRPTTTVRDVWSQADRDAVLRRVLARAESETSSADEQTAAGPVAAVGAGPRRPAVVRRRLVLAGALAAVLGAAVAVPSLTASPTYAATPPMLQFVPVAGQQSAATVLTDLARRARTQPPARGQGRYHYLHTKGWYLHVSADEDGIFDSGIAEIDRQMWQAADGSGRLLRVIPGDRSGMPPNREFGPGGLSGNFLPADATDAVARARYGHAATAAGWTRTIEEVWSQQVVPPALHARLLESLAAQPAVMLLGDTTDRSGRRGVAIAAEDQRGPRERLILVFDPDTGALLDAETVLLEDSDLPVQAPATISYTVWLATGHTDTTSSRP